MVVDCVCCCLPCECMRVLQCTHTSLCTWRGPGLSCYVTAHHVSDVYMKDLACPFKAAASVPPCSKLLHDTSHIAGQYASCTAV